MYILQNRKMYFRFTAILLAVFMIVSLLGACTKGDEESTKTTGSGTKTATVAKTTAKTTAKETTVTTANKTDSATNTGINESEKSGQNTGSAAEDIAGSDIGEVIADNVSPEIETIDFTVGNTLGKEINIDLQGITITHVNAAVTNLWGDTDSTRVEYRTLYRRLMDLAKKCNFKLDQKVLPSSSYYTEIVNATLAGVNIADIFVYTAGIAYPTYISNNIMVPLDEYIDYELPVVKANPYLYYGSLWKGRHYGYTPIYEYGYANTMYNRDLLSKEGQPDILDLVETKQWNWAAFLEIVKNCTKDTNGDGIIEQWGVGSNWNATFCKQILYSNGIPTLSFDGDNVYFNLNSAPGIRALQFASDLSFVYKAYKAGVANYTKGLVAIYLENYQVNNTILIGGLNSGLAPLPMGPDVDTYQNMETPTIYGILSTCSHPKEISQIMAEAMTIWDENRNPIPAYKELRDLFGGDSYFWSPINPIYRITTQREYELSYVALYGNFKADLSGGFPGLTDLINNSVYTNILNGKMSVSQAVTSVESGVWDILNQYK